MTLPGVAGEALAAWVTPEGRAGPPVVFATACQPSEEKGNNMNAFNRCMARVLIVCTMALGTPLPASADIVTTDQIYAGTERARVQSFLDRADVQAQMQSLGVDVNVARARVDALTDDEASRLAGQIDQLPAGADSFWGVLLAIFVILLITDILGLTKIFPFTRSVR